VPAPVVKLVMVKEGMCKCGFTGELRWLSVDSLPMHLPACPVCMKRLAGNALARLFYDCKKGNSKRAKQ
jgi:hypothetical protein